MGYKYFADCMNVLCRLNECVVCGLFEILCGDCVNVVCCERKYFLLSSGTFPMCLFIINLCRIFFGLHETEKPFVNEFLSVCK